jgi:hypothetical protein
MSDNRYSVRYIEIASKGPPFALPPSPSLLDLAKEKNRGPGDLPRSRAVQRIGIAARAAHGAPSPTTGQALLSLSHSGVGHLSVSQNKWKTMAASDAQMRIMIAHARRSTSRRTEFAVKNRFAAQSSCSSPRAGRADFIDNFSRSSSHYRGPAAPPHAR